MKRFLAPLALLLLLLGSRAEAATCFWVGGTASWTTANAASWSSSTGGTASTCAATGGIPKQAGDVAAFDANSGGGTVTVNGTFTIGSLNLSAFTGTLDFSANNNSITLSPGAGSNGFTTTSGTQTLNMGSGTWTVNCGMVAAGSCWNVANASLTLNANTSTLAFSVASSTCTGTGTDAIAMGGKTYATVTFAGPATCIYGVTGSNTFGHLTLTGPVALSFTASTTQTVSNAYTWNGSSGSPIFVSGGGSGAVTFSTPAGSTGTWIAFAGITFSSNVPVFSNCFNLARNSGLTCNAPSIVAGAGGIIGG